MDDIIFQRSTQNSVYVLNSNYQCYGNFACLNLIDTSDVISKDQSQCEHALLTSSGHPSCSADTRPLKYKLCNFGKFCDIPEAIGNLTKRSPTYETNVCGCDSLHSLRTDCCCGGGAGAYTDASRMQNTCKIKPNYSKKKNSINLKPSLIAKKTKFRKFIEAEKWKTGDECVMKSEYHNNQNARVDCTGSSIPIEFRSNSSVKISNAAESTTITAPMATITTCGSLNNTVKHYWNGKMVANAADSESKGHQQQNQWNNWSESGHTKNQHQQAQQQLDVLKSSQQQKTNYELYKEAAELLGLPCTLCDNCRCLECQGSYFDCDDSDSFSEVSNSDEYDEATMDMLKNSVELVMYANCYSDDTMIGNGISTIQQQQQKTARRFQERRQSNFICTKVICNAREMCGVSRDSHNIAGSGGDEAVKCTEQTDAINQNELHSVQNNESNELENCTIFKGLRLRDVNAEMPIDIASESRE